MKNNQASGQRVYLQVIHQINSDQNYFQMLDKNGFKSAGKNPKGIDLMQDKDQKRRNSTTNFYHEDSQPKNKRQIGISVLSDQGLNSGGQDTYDQHLKLQALPAKQFPFQQSSQQRHIIAPSTFATKQGKNKVQQKKLMSQDEESRSEGYLEQERMSDFIHQNRQAQQDQNIRNELNFEKLSYDRRRAKAQENRLKYDYSESQWPYQNISRKRVSPGQSFPPEPSDEIRDSLKYQNVLEKYNIFLEKKYLKSSDERKNDINSVLRKAFTLYCQQNSMKYRYSYQGKKSIIRLCDENSPQKQQNIHFLQFFVREQVAIKEELKKENYLERNQVLRMFQQVLRYIQKKLNILNMQAARIQDLLHWIHKQQKQFFENLLGMEIQLGME